MSGLTQAEWLLKLGANAERTATASDWEKGKTVPDVATLRGMVHLSGIDGHYLLVGEGTPVRADALVRGRYGLMERVLAGEMDEHIAGEIGPNGRRKTKRIPREGAMTPAQRREKAKLRKNDE